MEGVDPSDVGDAGTDGAPGAGVALEPTGAASPAAGALTVPTALRALGVQVVSGLMSQWMVSARLGPSVRREAGEAMMRTWDGVNTNVSVVIPGAPICP
ncbi:hypothetical protein, partial [Miniimonas arenae]|uniref:hypothetical protein n=1 Tax=Miniimonas arenae TaxID=676201 RepID=UPI0028B02900